jgi:hypothetical protein
MSSTRFSISRPSAGGGAPAAPSRSRSSDQTRSCGQFSEQHAVGGRLRLGEQGQPADAVVVPRDPDPLGRERGPAHPPGPVTARDEVAVHDLEFTRLGAGVRHRRPVTVDVVDAHVPDAEADRAAPDVGVLAHQVRHQQRLRIDEATRQ